MDTANPDIPQINIYLGSKDFSSENTVGTNTTLYADIYDSNGINMAVGFLVIIFFLVIDNSLQPIAITDYFYYDKKFCIMEA